MKKSAFLSLICLMMVCCSSYNVKIEIDESKALDSFAKTGIVFRMPESNEFRLSELENTFEMWLAPSTKNKTLSIVRNVDPSISVFNSDLDRFYQLSSTGTFQKYKSIGVITVFLRNNEEAVRKIFAEGQFDSLLFFEVDAGSSATMQFMTFNSTVFVIDSQMKICYMDYQKNSYDINDWFPDVIKKHLMDKISERLMLMLAKIDYVEMKK